MSDADRQRWNERYRQGAYADREHPSPWLVSCLSHAPPGRALDVACGTGRNALYLAERGYDVTAVDISRDALARARASADARGLAVAWVEQDLDDGVLPAATLAGASVAFDLIVVIRYVDIDLLGTLGDLLAPGGLLLVEEHLATDREDVAGPRNPAFRVAPGALGRAAAGLTVIESFEGETTDPDGRPVVVARLAARRPGGMRGVLQSER